MEIKYIRYRRKSSEQLERQAISLESQGRELNKIFPNIKIAYDLVESKSAFHPHIRPAFKQMIELIESGKANAIIAWHPNRISRNEIDAAIITYMVRIGKIVDIKFGSYNFDNSAEGIMMLQNAMAHSQYDSARLSKESIRGLKTKAELGWLPCGAKPGYMNERFADKGARRVLIDPERFTPIKKAWDLLLTNTYSVADILHILNEEWGYRTPKRRRLGGKPMSRSYIYKMFTDPFYYGEFEYPQGSGNWYQGKHEKMITRDEFDKAQLILGNKGRPRHKTLSFDYTGLIFCGECNAMITAEEKHQIICSECKQKFASPNKNECPKCKTLISEMKHPTRLHYVYYHCTKRKKKSCSQKSIRIEDLEEQLDEQLKNIQISEEFKDWAIKHLNEVAEKESEDHTSVLDSLQKAYDDCVKRIDNLVKLKISPQNTEGLLLPDDEFIEQKQALMKEKNTLKEKIDDFDGRVTQWVDLSVKTFDFACHARYKFATGDRQTKREILTGLGSNLTLLNRKVSISLEIPLEYIKDAVASEPSISEMLEPEEKADNTAQLEALWARNSTMLPREDSNLKP